MSNRPHKDGEEVTNPKHVFNDPRHRELIGRVRSSTTSGSPKKEPTSPGSEKKRKVYVPGQRHLGALANVFKPRRNTHKVPKESSSRPNSRDKDKLQSWSDWPIDDVTARGFHEHHEHHEQPEPYYTSDSEEGNRKEPDGTHRRTVLLPPLNRGEPQHARHSATAYRKIVDGELAQVYGHEEEDAQHPKWI